MNVIITDEVNPTIDPIEGDFDIMWKGIGDHIKDQLGTFDPNRTWLNLYLSHDGKPGFVRTIQRKT